MQAKVSIIMGSTSDLPVMEEAAKFLNEMEIPFELHEDDSIVDIATDKVDSEIPSPVEGILTKVF